jgi:O-antigen/teichoic acid export membrane protein
VVLAAVGPVALPEFSRRAREGKDLKKAYLTVGSHVSVVQWPAMIMLAALAEPAVLMVLGAQWLDVVPLLRVLSPALMFSVPIGLQFATLVAAGAVDRLPRLLILQTIVMAAALLITARYGLHAAAWSMLVVMPISAGLSLVAVHNVIAFRWRDLCAGAARSAFVALTTAAGPVAIALSASGSRMSQTSAATAVALGAAGWIFGLYASGHPFWTELCRAGAAILRLPVYRHLRFGR